MKRLLIAALLVTAVPSFADDDRDERMERPVVMDQQDLRAQLDELSRLLDQIASESSSKKRGRHISRAREELDELRRDVGSAPSLERAWQHRASTANSPPPPPVVQQVPPPPPPAVVPPVQVVHPGRPGSQSTPPSPPPGQGTYAAPPQGSAPHIYPIAQAQLEELRQSLRREAFGRDRLRVLESATHGHHFTVAQVQQLLPLFDFSGERLQAVRLLRPRILDMQNAFLLYGSFEYSNDKAELKKILGV